MTPFSLFAPRNARKSAGSSQRRRPATRRPSTRLFIEVLEDRTVPSTFTVNTAADTDSFTSNQSITSGSLRDAINYATVDPDAQTTIQFAIGSPGTVQTIRVGSSGLGALPPITHPVLIDGSSQGGSGYTGTPLIELNGAGAGPGEDGLDCYGGNTIKGLDINSFDGYGIALLGSNNTVTGCYVGTDPTGNLAEGNQPAGIYVDSFSAKAVLTGNTIGGTAPGQGNVISGNTNGAGILLAGFFNRLQGVVIQGNYIGTNAAGNAPLGNGYGVYLAANPFDTLIEDNLISGNLGAGVGIVSGYNNRVQGNSIYANGGLGIDLGANGIVKIPAANDAANHVGPNNLMNFPVLTAVSTSAGGTTVSGTLDLNTVGGVFPSGTPITLDFYANSGGYGQGQTWLGGRTLIADRTANMAFNFTDLPPMPAGQGYATATATDPAGNTSEFTALAATAMTLRAPPAVTYGQQGLVTVTVAANYDQFGSPPTPTGNVTLSVDNGNPVSGILSNTYDAFGRRVGSYTFNVGVLPAGTHTLYAVYAGQGGYAASYASRSLLVNRQATTTTLNRSSSLATFVSSPLLGPAALAFDSSGNLYVANILGNTVSKVTPSGTVSTFVSSGLSNPDALAFDTSGNLYIANAGNGTVSKVTPSGVVSTFVSGLTYPGALAVDSSGNLYIDDFFPAGFDTVSKVTPGGVVSTFVSNLFFTTALAFDSSGNLYIADQFDTVSEVTPSGVVSTFVSSGLDYPAALAFDSSGDLYVANQSPGTISRVTPGGTVSTFASTGLLDLAALAFDSSGNLYVADGGLSQVEKIPPVMVGQVVTLTTTVAGTSGGGAAPTSTVSFYDGGALLGVGSLQDLGGGTYQATLPVAFQTPGVHTISAVYSGDGTFLTSSSPPLSVVVSAVSSATLSAALASGQVTFQVSGPQATGQTQVNTIIAAVNALPGATTPVTVTLDLGGGTYSTNGVAVNPPANVNFVVQNGTLDPSFAALIVAGGNVTVVNCTLLTTGDAPTILVSGGSLTLRNDTVQESTGYNDAAIKITGGSLDLGTPTSPGGNTINVNGTGQMLVSTGPNVVTMVGTSFEVNGAAVFPVATVGLASSANPSIPNQAVTFSATVTAPTTGSAAPTGTVTFVDMTTGATLGSVNLSAGSASWTVPGLTVGTHTIAAVYSGDGHYLTSAATLVQTVLNFSGFLAPLNSNLAVAVNRVIPIKFQLWDSASHYVTSLSAIASLQVIDAMGANVLTNPGSTALRYDSSANQFVASWQTKGLPAGTYTVVLVLADGTRYRQTIQLTANSSGGKLVATDGGGATAGALLAGDIELYVDNSAGELTADELARITDAVAAVDAVIGRYRVTITLVSDPSVANVIFDMKTGSAVGGLADGVLGCTTDAGEITLITGWNWYAGASASGVAANQYDFQTVVTHELGHALGLGHSAVADSVMFATLPTGAVRRALVSADLNIPDVDEGACGLHAASSSPAAPACLGENPPILSPRDGGLSAAWWFANSGGEHHNGSNEMEVLVGGQGEDLLIGGEGRDLLVGGFAGNAASSEQLDFALLPTDSVRDGDAGLFGDFFDTFGQTRM
jgi:sugar lactone lactonase YvrE